MKIIDSNVWISFFNKDDINNKKARELLTKLMESDIYLTDYIIVEVVTILLFKAWKDIADSFVDFANNSINVKIIYSSQVLFDRYLDFFKFNNFLKLSFVDQTLVFLSKDFDIISFDRDLNKELS